MKTTTIRDMRREAILAAARELFSRQGYHGTSIPEIARAAGVSVGLIYHTFASKEDILLAISEHANADHIEIFARTREIADPLHRFDTIVRELYRSFDQGAKRFIILYKDVATLQPETRRRILALSRELDAQFLALFEEGQQSGVFSAAIPGDDLRVLAANVQSLGHTWALQKTWRFAPAINLDHYTSAQLQFFHRQLLAEREAAPQASAHVAPDTRSTRESVTNQRSERGGGTQ